MELELKSFGKLELLKINHLLSLFSMLNALSIK